MNSYEQLNPALFNEVASTVASGAKASVFFKKHCLHLGRWMESIVDVKLKQIDYNASTLVFWILNDLHDFPKCQNPACGKHIAHNVHSLKSGYRRFCSKACANSAPQTLQRREQLSMQRHGVPHFTNRHKSEETTFKHYGVKYPFQSRALRAKAAEQLVESYGISSYMEAPDFKEKSKQTMLKKHGVENVMQLPEKVLQAAATKEKRYGDRNFNNRALQKKTMLERHGVESNVQLESFKKMMNERRAEIEAKKKATLQEHYGMTHVPSFHYLYDGKSFDSQPEIAFYIWLEDNNIKFTFQPAISFEYFFDGKSYKYCPDFLVDSQFIELKGDHFFENHDPSCQMICPYNRKLDSLYEAKH